MYDKWNSRWKRHPKSGYRMLDYRYEDHHQRFVRRVQDSPPGMPGLRRPGRALRGLRGGSRFVQPLRLVRGYGPHASLAARAMAADEKRRETGESSIFSEIASGWIIAG